MGSGLRRNDPNDPVVKMLKDDPVVMEALNSRTQTLRKSVTGCLEGALAQDGKKLKSWVAVATWENEDGTVTETVMSDEHSTPLEIKGLLHDAVWSSAHAERLLKD